MDYAVLLYFDEETENKMLTLMKKLVDQGMNTYMFDNHIPPHVTLSLFHKDKLEGIEEITKAFVDTLSKEDICFASIGVFNPKVIFLAPVMTEFLMKACFTINKMLSETVADFDSNYLSNQWVPHAALGVKLEPEELKKAFEILQKEFDAFTGKVVKVAVTQCNPYVELFCYEL